MNNFPTKDYTHTVLNTKIYPPFSKGLEIIYLGMGCFWGAEQLFWSMNGIHTTAVGYQGDHYPVTYEELCKGQTEHKEVVMIVYNPLIISYEYDILTNFWNHINPTISNQQGNDIGKQYQTVIYCNTKKQYNTALKTKNNISKQYTKEIKTEIDYAPKFYYAEINHQQYLDKNPNGYCHINV